MKSVLVDEGVAEDKIGDLGIFDYLIPNFKKDDQTKTSHIIVAVVAQEKTGVTFINCLLDRLPNLYGVGFDEEAGHLPTGPYLAPFLPVTSCST